MDWNFAVFVVVVAAGALAAFVLYRGRMQRRVHRIQAWVGDYLVGRYGKRPADLHISCSDDTLWPVLVAFDDPATGARRRLRFHCPGAGATFSLLQEEVDAPSPAEVERVTEDRADVARFEGDGGKANRHGQSDWQNRQDEDAAQALHAARR